MSEKLKTRLIETRAKLRLLPMMPRILPRSKWTPSRFLTENANKRPNGPAIKYLDTLISWRELDTAVNEASAAFLEMGVRKDDEVVVLVDNRPTFIVLLLALSRLQAVAVLLNTSITGKQTR